MSCVSLYSILCHISLYYDTKITICCLSTKNPYYAITLPEVPIQCLCIMYLIDCSGSLSTIIFNRIISYPFASETKQGIVGHNVPPNVMSTHADGIYLFPDLRFAGKGKIQAWEVLAMKAGVIRLLVSIETLPIFKLLEVFRRNRRHRYCLLN